MNGVAAAVNPGAGLIKKAREGMRGIPQTRPCMMPGIKLALLTKSLALHGQAFCDKVPCTARRLGLLSCSTIQLSCSFHQAGYGHAALGSTSSWRSLTTSRSAC